MTEDPDPRADHGVSPTVRLWQLAESLREHRERAGLTIEQAAERLKPRSPRWSRSKVQRIETRLYAPQPSEVEHLTAVYEPARPGTRPTLVAMAREARQKGWWTTHDLLKPVVQTLVGLEQAATTVRQFELALLPGLLQTPEYARALIAAIDRRPRSRCWRAGWRRGWPASTSWPVPTPCSSTRCSARPCCAARWAAAGIWRSQLERLVELAGQPNITIQVLPFAAGPHAGLEGAFTLLTVPQLASDVAYVEGPAGGVILESRDDVRRCTMRFAVLGSMALSPSATRDLIGTTLGEQA